MRRNERVKYVYFDAFDYRVEVVLCSKLAESRKRRDKKLGKDPDSLEDEEALHCYNAADATSHLFLPFNADPGTVAHECAHVVQAMMDHVGAEYEKEVFAYHLGYLVKEVCQWVEACRRR